MNEKAMVIENQIRKYLDDKIKVEEAGISAHKALAAVLREKFNGKKLTKRIEGYFRDKFFVNAQELKEKALVRYSENFGMCQLQLSGIFPWDTYDKQLLMFICHKGDKSEAYDPESFESEDCCHATPAEKRNASRFEFCQGDDIKRVAEIAAQMDELRAELESLTEFGKPGETVEYMPAIERQRSYTRK